MNRIDAIKRYFELNSKLSKKEFERMEFENSCAKSAANYFQAQLKASVKKN